MNHFLAANRVSRGDVDVPTEHANASGVPTGDIKILVDESTGFGAGRKGDAGK